MKKAFLILCMLTLLSCSQDDAAPLNITQALEGQYKQTALRLNNEENEQDLTDCSVTQIANLYTFNSSGTYTSVPACDENPDVNPPVFTYSYLTNGQLTLNSNPYNYTYNVNELPGDKIKLVLLTSTMDGQTVDHSSTGYYEIYQKQ